MSHFSLITAVFLDTILARLVPWFLVAAGGDMAAARCAASGMLASFNVETEEEVRLAAEIACFGLGALEALSRSVDPDLPLNTVLRLRGSANALQRSKNQCQRSLDKLRKERRSGQAVTEALPKPEERTDNPDDQQALSSIASVSAQPTAGITLSRQQRRAMQRAVDKAQRKHAEQVRRETMRASRIATAPLTAQSAIPGREAQALPPFMAAAYT